MKKSTIFFSKITSILCVFLISGACQKNPLGSKIPEVDIRIEINRFEKTLFSVDPSAIADYIPEWKTEYGSFFSHFCLVAGLGNTNDPEFPERLKLFTTDQVNYTIYKRTLDVFDDLNNLNANLNDAFRHYLYYFPDKKAPKVYTFISSFRQSAITDSGLLAIGLDRYLGSDESLYKVSGIYNYLLVNMHPEKIVSDCMRFWGETEFEFNDSIDNLITNMIYRGRLMYFVRAMLPEQPDSLIWGFRSIDLKYLNSAEKYLWTYLIDHKLLFATDRFTMDKFILEGPFTKDFGRSSPGRAAVWTGYKIVEAYMKRNKEISLPRLMQERDYIKILNNSGYNP